MPKGATVIDYAYMIHTDIGNSMVAAKVSPYFFRFDEYFFPKDIKSNEVILYLQVNGNIVPPLHVLANAEVVEIVTYNVS